MSERKLLTPRQVADILCCSVQTVYRIAGTKELPAFRPEIRGDGKRPMVRVWSDDLDRYIAAQMRADDPPSSDDSENNDPKGGDK